MYHAGDGVLKQHIYAIGAKAGDGHISAGITYTLPH